MRDRVSAECGDQCNGSGTPQLSQNALSRTAWSRGMTSVDSTVRRRSPVVFVLIALCAVLAGCSRMADHEGGTTSQYDAVPECDNNTFRPSQEVTPYAGTWEAKAHYTGSGGGCSRAGGAFRVNAPDGYEGYYGAAFYVPPGTFTGGTSASQTARFDIITWDNYATYGNDADYGGIAVYQGYAWLVRGKVTDDPTEVIGDTFTVGEGCWNWIVVHQKLSNKPASDPAHAINEVFLNGSKVVDSASPNSYGRTAQDVRFGMPYVSPSQANPLDVYVDNAYVSNDTRLPPLANACSAPDTTITSGPPPMGAGSDSKLTYASSEPGSRFLCRLDSGSWLECPSPTRFEDLRDGAHTVEASAVDSENNMDLTPASWNWTADGEANGDSLAPDISANGYWAAFESEASNLVPGDTNGVKDVFVFDTDGLPPKRLSVSSTGEQGNGPSYDASISEDGRYVAFTSDASNLVSGDTNGVSDVFVHDRVNETTVRVSNTNSGGQSYGPSTDPDIAANVAFTSTANLDTDGHVTNGIRQVFLASKAGLPGISLMSRNNNGDRGNADSYNPSTAGPGVAFSSDATNLVSDDTNGVRDIYIRRLQLGTYPVSRRVDGTQANGSSDRPSLSADTCFVAFESSASNLITHDFEGNPDTDTNGLNDIFRYRVCEPHDMLRISQRNASSPEPNGSSFRPAIGGDRTYGTPDGQYVVFESKATNLVGVGTDRNGAGRDIFRWSGQKYTDPCCPGVQLGPIDLMSHKYAAPDGFSLDSANDSSIRSSVTANGVYIVYESYASDLWATGDTHTTDITVTASSLAARDCWSIAADRTGPIEELCHKEADYRAVIAARLSEGDCLRRGGGEIQCAIEAMFVYTETYRRIYQACLDDYYADNGGT
jgi:hypothetical protein